MLCAWMRCTPPGQPTHTIWCPMHGSSPFICRGPQQARADPSGRPSRLLATAYKMHKKRSVVRREQLSRAVLQHEAKKGNKKNQKKKERQCTGKEQNVVRLQALGVCTSNAFAPAKGCHLVEEFFRCHELGAAVDNSLPLLLHCLHNVLVLVKVATSNHENKPFVKGCAALWHSRWIRARLDNFGVEELETFSQLCYLILHQRVNNLCCAARKNMSSNVSSSN